MHVPAEWTRFARERTTDQFQLLGSVRKGASIGALAVAPDGRYLQVNGDYVSSIDTNKLRRAVQAATSQMASVTRLPMAAQRRDVPSPVVVIKRRRSLASAALSRTATQALPWPGLSIDTRN